MIKVPSHRSAAQYSERLSERLIIALDVETKARAIRLIEQLMPLGVTFKVGMQLFYQEGLSMLTALSERNCPVFVDLKLHDIPTTVAGATEALVRHGAGFLNVHAQGGPEMMAAAAEAGRRTAERLGRPKPLIVAVTVLTSLSEAVLQQQLKITEPLRSYAVHLAESAKASGLDGVVCSAHEAALIRAACGPDFILVTPGIRPAGKDVHDQSRVLTPARAMAAGADYLVVGRPVTQADDPVAAAQRILDEMFSNLEGSGCG